VAFTGSQGYQETAKQTQTKRQTSFQTTSQCRQYTAGLQPLSNNLYKLTPAFQAAVNLLETTEPENYTPVYNEFLSRWGTHYTVRGRSRAWGSCS